MAHRRRPQPVRLLTGKTHQTAQQKQSQFHLQSSINQHITRNRQLWYDITSDYDNAVDGCNLLWDLVIGWWRCVSWIDWLSWLEQWEMVFIYQSPRPYLNNHHKQTKWASLVVKQRRCGWTEPPQTTQEHSGGEETTGNCLHGPHLGFYIIANGLRFGSFSSFNWWPSWWKCLENINIFFWVVDIGLLNTWFTIATIKCCNSWSNIGSSSSDSLQIWGEILKNPQKSDLEFKRLWTFVTGWSLIRWSRQKVSEIIFD